MFVNTRSVPDLLEKFQVWFLIPVRSEKKDEKERTWTVVFKVSPWDGFVSPVKRVLPRERCARFGNQRLRPTGQKKVQNVLRRILGKETKNHGEPVTSVVFLPWKKKCPRNKFHSFRPSSSCPWRPSRRVPRRWPNCHPSSPRSSRTSWSTTGTCSSGFGDAAVRCSVPCPPPTTSTTSSRLKSCLKWLTSSSSRRTAIWRRTLLLLWRGTATKEEVSILVMCKKLEQVNFDNFNLYLLFNKSSSQRF